MLNARLLVGRYRLVERVGSGRGTVVWRAYDEVLRRLVAVKLVEEGRREAAVAARLSHPNLTRVYDYGEAVRPDGSRMSFVVTELVEGPSLADLMAAGPLPWRTAVRVCADVASGLAAAHAAGVVHSEVRPASVILTAGGVKLVGFAAPAGPPGDAGTAAGDVHALGVLISRLLAAASADLPTDLAPLCARCVAPIPADRPGSVEVAAALADAIVHLGGPPRVTPVRLAGGTVLRALPALEFDDWGLADLLDDATLILPVRPTTEPAPPTPARVRRLHVGRLHVGRLGVGRLHVGRLHVGRLHVGRLHVGRLHVGRLGVGRLGVGRLHVGPLRVRRLGVGQLRGRGPERLRPEMDRPERNRDRPERRRRAAIARTGSLAAAVAMVLFVAATYPLTRGGGAGWVAAGTGPVRGGPPGCAVTYQVDPGRSGLPTGDLTLTFTASDPASAWTLTFALPAGQRLVDLAGGDWSQTGHLVTVRRGAGGQGGATHLPFRLSFAGPYRDGDSPPSSFALDGVACSTDLGGSADGGAGDPARTGIAAGCWPCPPDGTGDGRNPTTVRLPGQHRTGTGAAGGSTAAGAGSVTSVTGPLPGASPAGPVPGAPPTGPGAPPTDPVPGVPPTTPPPAPTPPSTPTPTPPVTPVPTEPPHPTVPPTDPPTQAPTPTPYPTPYPQPSTVPPSPSQPPAPHPASSPPSPPHASVPAQTATPV